MIFLISRKRKAAVLGSSGTDFGGCGGRLFFFYYFLPCIQVPFFTGPAAQSWDEQGNVISGLRSLRAEKRVRLGARPTSYGRVVPDCTIQASHPHVRYVSCILEACPDNRHRVGNSYPSKPFLELHGVETSRGSTQVVYF